MLEFYTAYVLASGGKERFTGIMAVSQGHARSIACVLWMEKHDYLDCPYRIEVRMDDLN